jgi:hypothetical protein
MLFNSTQQEKREKLVYQNSTACTPKVLYRSTVLYCTVLYCTVEKAEPQGSFHLVLARRVGSTSCPPDQEELVAPTKELASPLLV